MAKKILLLALAALLLTGMLVPAALAATTDDQQQDIIDFYNKLAEYRKQLVKKYLDAGLITKEQAAIMNQRIDLITEYQRSWTAQGAYGPGFGCFGGGPGFCGGFRGAGMWW
ncbi:MAG: DUF2680 domain-containing protein [Thermoanaerobacteraceae bacterium]|nr:DUF2680 domain-containing protein [Thermoanaerobacteraceae bacterium]